MNIPEEVRIAADDRICGDRHPGQDRAYEVIAEWARKEDVDPYPYVDDNGYRWVVGGGSGPRRLYQPRNIFTVINEAKATGRKEALREASAVVRAYPSSHSDHVASILDERALAEGVPA